MTSTSPSGLLQSERVRNSCLACASSKVGCAKEKPRCRRCERKNLDCVYATARRPGRPATRGPPAHPTHAHVADASPVQHPFGSAASLTGSPPQTVSLTPSTDELDVSTAFSNVSTGYFNQDRVNCIPTLSHDQSDWTALLSPVSVVPNIVPHLFTPSEHHFYGHVAPMWRSRDMSEHIEYVDGEIMGESLFQDGTGNADVQRASQTEDQYVGQYDPTRPSKLTTESACACTKRCLDILRYLTPDDPGLRKTASSFESVMKRNDAALRTVEEILSRECCEGGMMLFLLSLVVVHALGWYAACASSSSCDGHEVPMVAPPAVQLPDYDVERSFQSRIAGQLVMAKLHHAQHTVNLLSSRLSLAGGKVPHQSRTMSRLDNLAGQCFLDGPMHDPSTSKVLVGALVTILKSDLRKLSQAIVDEFLQTAVTA